MTVEIRAFSDFEKIPIFISEFDFYIFTKVGFQSDSRFLIGWQVPTNQKLKPFSALFLPGRDLLSTKNLSMQRIISIWALIYDPYTKGFHVTNPSYELKLNFQSGQR